MNNNLNELMELKNYVNYLIEMVLSEEEEVTRDKFNKTIDDYISSTSDRNYATDIAYSDKTQDPYLVKKAREAVTFKASPDNPPSIANKDTENYVKVNKMLDTTHNPNDKESLTNFKYDTRQNAIKYRKQELAKKQQEELSKIPSANQNPYQNMYNLTPDERKKEAFAQRLGKYKGSNKQKIDDIKREIPERLNNLKDLAKSAYNNPKGYISANKGALAGAAGVAGLGLAGYAAYKLAKKKKKEKEAKK
jgi:hypothetical protein